jgi:hypothetical protein
MTLRIWLLLLGLVVAGFCAVDAATADTTTTTPPVKKTAGVKKKSSKTKKKAVKAKKVSQIKKATSGELQTDVKFDDSVLHGQYQTPDEALARVENEKGLSDLLGVRKHFKDRLATASDQE